MRGCISPRTGQEQDITCGFGWCISFKTVEPAGTASITNAQSRCMGHMHLWFMMALNYIVQLLQCRRLDISLLEQTFVRLPLLSFLQALCSGRQWVEFNRPCWWSLLLVCTALDSVPENTTQVPSTLYLSCQVLHCKWWKADYLYHHR